MLPGDAFELLPGRVSFAKKPGAISLSLPLFMVLRLSKTKRYRLSREVIVG